MTVYLLWAWYSYENRVLHGVYTTRELAESAVPGARWVDGEAFHPVYDMRWKSSQFEDPEIEEWAVLDRAVPVSEVPDGPQFGPPLSPRCSSTAPWVRCVLLAGHDGDHKMERYYPMTTTDYLLFSASVAKQ